LAQTRNSLLRSDASALAENPTLGGQGQNRRSCEGFRMPAATKGAAGSGGRRSKTSKGGNRGKGYVWRGSAMEI
jgi:hypothetical protein